MNQTLFFAKLGTSLQKHGYEIAYVSFHEKSLQYLEHEGFMAFNAFNPKANYIEQINLETYSWVSLNLTLSHEREAFEVSNSTKLITKLKSYLAVIEEAFDVLLSRYNRVSLIQELGGFLSIVSAHYAARRRSLDSYFLEPSFFKGRFIIQKNSLMASQITEESQEPLLPEVSKYLKDVESQQSIVIPSKDRNHYRKPIYKLTDSRNWQRLIQKSIDRYVLGHQEEFSYIGGHVGRHLRMWLNAQRLATDYQQIPDNFPFVYYPFHVPADVALTLRSPEYLDQYALIDYLARSIPNHCQLVIKEHPALVGGIHYKRLRGLLNKYDNLVLLNPGINNYEILKCSAAVVTVNSKSGAEALLLGKPVIVLGNAFYTESDLVIKPTQLSDLPILLAKAVSEPPLLDSDKIKRYFQSVWSASYSGEIYSLDSKNIMDIVTALMSEIKLL
ncbi:MAG: capsule biosynthesis protein [Spirulina sp. SIO3F2]|nr:capsule biosynthesis protein [Spirulina sp. SIO3F2]